MDVVEYRVCELFHLLDTNSEDNTKKKELLEEIATYATNNW